MVEDASWLRKEDDAAHINLAELEAANEAIKAAVAWGLKDIEIMTDSATVFRWLTNATRGDGPVRSSGMSELLVKRRICTIKQTIEEEQLRVEWKLVSSAENRADRLTRVPSDWLIAAKDRPNEAAVTMEGEEQPIDCLQALHAIPHFKVKRMMFLVRKL